MIQHSASFSIIISAHLSFYQLLLLLLLLMLMMGMRVSDAAGDHSSHIRMRAGSLYSIAKYRRNALSVGAYQTLLSRFSCRQDELIAGEY